MIREETVGIDGKKIVFLTPENKKDIEELKKKQTEGKLSDFNSFSDWKNEGKEKESMNKG
jgi:DNA-binding MarR family transcriptional regulator